MSYGKKFEDALVHASRIHQDQKRKGTEIPYITHLLAVAAIVGENGGTEDEVVAALLHDAIEDTSETRESLTGLFGETVAEIVSGCSDADSFPKPPWLERKQAYIEHVQHASHSVRLVSAADKLHNARSILHDYRLIGEPVWRRFAGGKEGTLWYYRSLVEAFGGPDSGPLIAELSRVVEELDLLAAQSGPRNVSVSGR